MEKPDKVTGIRHVYAAATYSMGGLKRALGETAFRHEALAFVPVLAVLFYCRASLVEFAIAFALFMVLLATEALNTAIECIVDHVSPGWAEFAKDAKDLGSFAVFCLLLANGAFPAAILIRYLAG
jgi:diacylglycerol kinase (ATP)